MVAHFARRWKGGGFVVSSYIDAMEYKLVSPYVEVLCFEYLYSLEGASLRKIASETVESGKLPSEVFYEKYGFVYPRDFEEVQSFIGEKLGSFEVAINQTPTWPKKLIDSSRPTPLLYYRGDIGLVESRSVSVVGSRKASQDGIRRAEKIARELAESGIAVVTGLAAGIDTAATLSCLSHHGRSIAVIGTPIDECYPLKNRDLQEDMSKKQLVVSQVPFYRYSKQPFSTKRYYFPERNELMAAVSDATVIVEASDTSGTLTQARACLRQGRPLFIMRSCVENPSVEWPGKYIGKEGVYVLDDTSQIIDVIGLDGKEDANGKR